MNYNIQDIARYKEIDKCDPKGKTTYFTTVTEKGELGTISWLGIQWKWLKSVISFGHWGTRALDQETLKMIHIANEIFGRKQVESIASHREILNALENLKKINRREGGNYLHRLDQCIARLQVFPKEEKEIGDKAAILRLIAFVGAQNEKEEQLVKEVFNRLSGPCQAILREELNKPIPHAIFFNSSFILANCLKGKKGKQKEEALHQGLEVLARLYQDVRCNLKTKTNSHGYHLDISQVAQAISMDRKGLKYSDIEIDFKGHTVESVKFHQPVDLSKFKSGEFKSLKDIPGEKILFVGIGGGSDGINADRMKRLAAQSGKSVVGTVSVRTEYVSYAPPHSDIKVGDLRSLVHADEKAKGVYCLCEKTDGVKFDRFFENKMVNGKEDRSAYIIFDPYQKSTGDNLSIAELAKRFNELKKFLDFDTIVAVDTGGDALFRPAIPGAEKKGYKREATPDQDLRVLMALNKLNDVNCVVMELATGVDTPSYAEEVLEKAKASFFDFTAEQKEYLLAQYRELGMDETHVDMQSQTGLFGKTPSALQQAFDPTKEGYTFIPLPVDRVIAEESPINPCVDITDAMRGVFLMRLKDLIATYGIKG
jgi:hypothetical protein